MFAVALAVGLTPELLPMIVTVTLARSAMQMAKRKVIVKRLSAIHDLGAMNVLCTDKTGTLTEATIKLVRTIDGHGAECARAFCLRLYQQPVRKRHEKPARRGDPGRTAVRHDAGCSKIDEVPFDFERRRVSVLVEHDAKRRLIVKGAPEDLLRLSGLLRGRRRRGAAARRPRRAPLPGHPRRARRAGLPRAGDRQPPASMRATRPPRSPTRPTSCSPASPFSSIRRKPAPAKRSGPWRRPASR